MNNIPDVQNDIELVFDILADNPLSDGDRETASYLEYTYIKDNSKGHTLEIYNPITEEVTRLAKVK